MLLFLLQLIFRQMDVSGARLQSAALLVDYTPDQNPIYGTS